MPKHSREGRCVTSPTASYGGAPAILVLCWSYAARCLVDPEGSAASSHRALFGLCAVRSLVHFMPMAQSEALVGAAPKACDATTDGASGDEEYPCGSSPSSTTHDDRGDDRHTTRAGAHTDQSHDAEGSTASGGLSMDPSVEVTAHAEDIVEPLGSSKQDHTQDASETAPVALEHAAPASLRSPAQSSKRGSRSDSLLSNYDATVDDVVSGDGSPCSVLPAFARLMSQSAMKNSRSPAAKQVGITAPQEKTWQHGIWCWVVPENMPPHTSGEWARRWVYLRDPTSLDLKPVESQRAKPTNRIVFNECTRLVTRPSQKTHPEVNPDEAQDIVIVCPQFVGAHDRRVVIRADTPDDYRTLCRVLPTAIANVDCPEDFPRRKDDGLFMSSASTMSASASAMMRASASYPPVCGWLQKCVVGRSTVDWSRRWFVLPETGHLQYFKRPEDTTPAHCLGEIPVRSRKTRLVTRPSKESHAHAAGTPDSLDLVLTAYYDGTRVKLLLRCDNAKDKAMWVEALALRVANIDVERDCPLP